MFFLVVVYIEAMHEIECTAPSSTFPYKIDCAKFITISKATNEKMINPDFDLLLCLQLNQQLPVHMAAARGIGVGLSVLQQLLKVSDNQARVLPDKVS